MVTYFKTLWRMLKSNVIRLIAVSAVIAVGVGVAAGVGALPAAIRDALAAQNMSGNEYISSMADKIDIIAVVFSVFFVAVSLLVALTTMTRLTEEERPIIACYKTLGYGGYSIITKYLCFAGVCCVLGAGLGFIIGRFGILPVIFDPVASEFGLKFATENFYLGFGFIAAVAISFATLAATAIACSSLMRETPAATLRPKAPKAGKQTFLEHMPFIWKRLKFKYKSSVRNILLHIGRLLTTALSAAGATALMFAGMGLHSSLSNDGHTYAPGMIDTIMPVSIAITLCAVALAVLVLFTLSNVMVAERRREIATLKVLGYRDIEVAGHIYRETLILAVLGILIGLPAGYLFLNTLFVTLNFGAIETMQWYIWPITAAVSLAALGLVDALLAPKIVRTDMLSSLKTVE